MSVAREHLQAAYENACRQEIEALKPGNVHVFADGHDMTFRQFLHSAAVSSRPLTDPGLAIGQRILQAVRATRAAVGVNTNLGIVLLAGPLLRAAEMRTGVLRSNLIDVLQGLDMSDARAVFAAITHARPGGLGEADGNDVRQPPETGLLEAMKQAADRDMIARQYVTGFADVFEAGLARLDDATKRDMTGMWPCVFTYLGFLAGFPDSHVARKWGSQVALDVQRKAGEMLASLAAESSEDARRSMLLAFDRQLKADGINPGTSADLTVACLLVRDLRDNLHIPVVDD